MEPDLAVAARRISAISTGFLVQAMADKTIMLNPLRGKREIKRCTNL